MSRHTVLLELRWPADGRSVTEVAQEAQRELPSEDAARGSGGLGVPVYKSGEYGDVGGGCGGGGGRVLEEEEEAEVMEWWRGRALLRLALFADEGHPSLAPHTHTTAASSSTCAQTLCSQNSPEHKCKTTSDSASAGMPGGRYSLAQPHASKSLIQGSSCSR